MTSPGDGEPPASDSGDRPGPGEPISPWARREPTGSSDAGGHPPPPEPAAQVPGAAAPAGMPPVAKTVPLAATPPPAPSAPPPAPETPPPPAGPGVQPPFPAPPEERDVAKLALGLVVGGLAVVICLVGCVAGLVGVVVWQVNETNKDAKAAVTRFLEAMVDDDASRAEADVCDEARRADFVDNLADRFPADLESFEVRDLADNPDKLVVPATLAFDNGSTHDVDFVVSQEIGGAGSSQQVKYLVCGADW